MNLEKLMFYVQVFALAGVIGMTLSLPLLFMLDRNSYLLMGLLGLSWVLTILNNDVAKQLFEKWFKRK